MKFMTLVKSVETNYDPPQELIDAIAKLGIEATANGTMVTTGGLLPTGLGAKVRLTGGKISITDGPFAEAKEVIGGFAIFDLKSKEDAVQAAKDFLELHKQHWPGWDGEVEVRQIFEA